MGLFYGNLYGDHSARSSLNTARGDGGGPVILLVPASPSVEKLGVRNPTMIAQKRMYFSASGVNLCVLRSGLVRARINHRIAADSSQFKSDQR